MAAGRPPCEWRFSRTELGKLTILDPAGSGLDVSISHTEHVVALAVSDTHNVGVDVEPTSYDEDPVVWSSLTPAERVRLEATPAADRPAQFLRMWTLKEAYVKCTGAGASRDFERLDTSFDPPAVVADHRGEATMTPCEFSQEVWNLDGQTQWVTVAARPRIGTWSGLAPRERPARLGPVVVPSGALLLVAVILLLLGLAGPALGFVYASIAVSLTAIVFMMLAVLQRRAQPGAVGGNSAGSTLTARLMGRSVTEPGNHRKVIDVRVAPRVDLRKSGPKRLAGAPEALVDAGPAPTARQEREGDGLRTPFAAPPGVAGPGEPEPPVEAGATLLDDVEDLDTAVGAAVLVVPGRLRYHLAGCRYLSGWEPEECSPVDARERGFTPCGVCRPDSTLVAEHEHRVLRTGSRRVDAAAGSGAARGADAPARPRKRPAEAYKGPVVVLSDRGRFHRPDCRYVREIDGGQQLTRSQAVRLDYTPCGVCRP